MGAPDVPRRRLAAAALLAVLASAACGEGGEPPRRGVAFDSIFREEARIALEPDTADPVVEVTAMARRPDGEFLVADGPTGRIRVYDGRGRRLGVRGRPGEGPGELRQPADVAVGRDGDLYVVQRGGPRVTVYGREDTVGTFPLPGHYGHWIAPAGSLLAVGAATRGDRFALMTPAGDTVARFGPRRPDPARYPAGRFVFDDHAAVADGRVLVNTSFSPRVRVHDASGDSVRSFGRAPPSWDPPGPLGGDGAGVETEAEVRSWLRGGTVVAGLAVVADSLVVVQYGRFEPTPEQDARLVPATVDVYRLDGAKLFEEVPLDEPILAGGDRLYTLAGEPPGPWTIAAHAPRPPPDLP